MRIYIYALCAICVTACVTNTGPIADSGQINDDTEWLQSLLNTRERDVIIPAGERPWYTGPLFVTGNDRRIEFEAGCTIKALPGSFQGLNDCLLTVIDADNLIISGFDATLYMPRSDYQRKPYERGEWRHSVAIFRSQNITVEGLRIEGSGGDGVYVGQRREEPVCENITLRHLQLIDHHRQGVSVIAVKGFLMEYCYVSGTKGTPPAAAIDFEPNSGLYGITGAVIRDCVFERNAGPGILVYLIKLNPDHPPVDILIERTTSRRNLSGTAIYSIPKGVRGHIEFRDCDIRGIRWIWTPKSFTVRFLKSS